MKYVLAFIACTVCKAVHAILRLTNKGGTAFPGRIALFICPDVLKICSRGVKTLMITGTNGKTTSARMAETALNIAGYSVFSNRSGANLIDGIACAFILNTGLFLKPKCGYAVIECDEAASKRVIAEIKPEAVLITNLFRDQLDRYGSVKAPRDAIVKGLGSCPGAILCVNADCQIAASIAEITGNKTLYFGMSTGDRQSVGSGEDDRCIFCKGRLSYAYLTYANLGAYRCIKCGNRRKDTQVSIESVLPDGEFIVSVCGEKRLGRINNPGLYGIYNAAGVITLCRAAGISADIALKAVSDFECGFGRMEEFKLGRAGAMMILIKNAAGADQTLDLIKRDHEPKTVVLAINNRPADGVDISWLNDCDLGKISRMHSVKRVYVTGECAEEAKKRLSSEKITCEVVDDYDILLKILSTEDSFIYLLPTYTAMLIMREKLVKRLGGKNFRE